MTEKPNSFAVLKSVSAAITFYRERSLFEHVPTFPLWRCLFGLRSPTLGDSSQAEKAILHVGRRCCVRRRLIAAAFLSGNRRAVIWGSSPVVSSSLVACVVFDEWVLTRPVGLSFSNDDNFCDDRFALLGGGMTSTGRAPELPSWHQA